jgi:hypothetical protein
MSDKPENPSAFPHPVPQGCWGDPSCGMTLRDYFAGQVLAGIGHKTSGTLSSATDINDLLAAKTAYRIADAMLAERSRHE